MLELWRSRRLALVVGNGHYSGQEPLENPGNDVRAIAGALERVGFSVTRGIDLNSHDMRGVFDDFGSRAINADVALIFFSGHGVQIEGENYLLPTDVAAGTDEIKSQSIRLSEYLRKISKTSNTCLVFLDACRDNPAANTRSVGRQKRLVVGRDNPVAQLKPGLAAFDFPAGEKETFIAFATAPGTTAYDGAGANSPFSEALLKFLGIPGLDLNNFAARVTEYVRGRTKQKQTPWINTCITRPFYFKRRSFAPVLLMLVLGSLSGVLSYFLKDIEQGKILDISLIPGLLFSLVVMVGVKSWEERNSSLLLPPLFVLIAWFSAVYVHQGVVQRIQPILEDKISKIESVTSQYETALADIEAKFQAGTITDDERIDMIDNEKMTLNVLDADQRSIAFLRKGLPGMIAGLVGAAIITLGCALSVVALRRADVVAIATLLGGAIVPLVGYWAPRFNGTDISELVLFGSWQGTIAACLGFGFATYIQETRAESAPFLYVVKPPAITYAMLFCAIASAVVSALFLIKDSPLGLSQWQPTLFGTRMGPSLAFGLVVSYVVYALKKPDLGYAIIHFFTTSIGWIAGFNAAILLPFDPVIAIPLGGLVGAAVTLAGPSLSIPSLRHPATWLLVMIVGLVAAVPYALLAGEDGTIAGSDQLWSMLLLFVPWQVAITACLAYGLLRPGPSPMDSV